MSRVWLSSPPRRTSLATGKSPDGRLAGGIAEPARSAAAAPPTTNATSTNAKLVARTDMDFPALRAFLLHYEGAVNRNLTQAGGVPGAPAPPLPSPTASP